MRLELTRQCRNFCAVCAGFYAGFAGVKPGTKSQALSLKDASKFLAGGRGKSMTGLYFPAEKEDPVFEAYTQRRLRHEAKALKREIEATGAASRTGGCRGR